MSPLWYCAVPLQALTIEQALREEDPDHLATVARIQGDAKRGAILFYQSYLACTKCHLENQQSSPLGPDLTRMDRDLIQRGPAATARYIVDSILHPSREIKKRYEVTTVVTKEGRRFQGMIVNQDNGRLLLRDLNDVEKQIELPGESIEHQGKSNVSLMPQGLVNQLASRQQFLDLVRYLTEIATNGPKRALQLKPPASLLVSTPLPEYENHLDHRVMIAEMDEESFLRGQAIYNQLCVNCHGTKDLPGSMPTSLRFASGQFKNGHDPLTMYHTLTRGFGMMVPQRWMVPQQKYDVIHFIRQAYLKPNNPAQYFEVTESYLQNVPSGDTRGPDPVAIEPWSQMDYGHFLTHTYEVPGGPFNIAYKGIAVRLDAGAGGVSQGSRWMLFDHDTMRMAAGWSGQGFTDWNGIMFNGRHDIHPTVVGRIAFSNGDGPGWAKPADPTFDDSRLKGRDGRHYGPLPRQWTHYRGMYSHGNNVIFSYTVGEASVLEMPGVIEIRHGPVFTRTFHIGPRENELVLQIAQRKDGHVVLQDLGDAQSAIASKVVTFDSQPPRGTKSTTDSPAAKLGAGLLGDFSGVRWATGKSENLRLKIPAGDGTLKFILWLGEIGSRQDVSRVVNAIDISSPKVADLQALTCGGSRRWTESIETQWLPGSDDLPLTTDVLQRPTNNPWFCQMRFSGLDFMPDGRRMVICDWDGDVWLVSGIDHADQPLRWQRIASGLFQPLGIRIVNGKIHVSCRDQICILHDLNADGETDFYENFNNDHQVTEHFHEFAMGLQIDAQGNFYYAKSARHAKPALVPHHGTLLRVSPDGARTDIVAKGFRAANGVCVNSDGTFFVTDQEGHWTPKNRINRVKAGAFYGNMLGYHEVTDSSDHVMQQPLCWIAREFDRSPAELLWVEENANWGPLNGSLLNFSYGYGKVYIVPFEELDGQVQGGMCELPVGQFPTGVMRGRFHPGNGQLYCCGMFAWSGTRQETGGVYRLRYTGQPIHVPVALKAHKNSMQITFSGKLDRKTTTDVDNWAVETWSLKRTAEYGSDHYDERDLDLAGVDLSEDGRTVVLRIHKLKTTWCMKIGYSVRSAKGQAVQGAIHNSVFRISQN